MGRNDWLTDKLRNLDDDAFVEVLAEVTERSAVTEKKVNDDIVHITDIEDEIKDEHRNWGQIRGLSTGFPALDKRIGGLGNGDVILIGGETSNGKSALAANIAVNIAKRPGGVGVLFITLEMQAKQIGSRFYHINGGKIDDLDIMFQLEPRITYTDLKPVIRRAMEEGEVKCVFLDYLQYLGRGMKNEEVAKMSKEIKTLALEFDIPFIVIVSLRKSESGKGKRRWTEIEIEDFMGTGSIGYDADSAMIASRKNLEDTFTDDRLYVKVLKTRNARLDYKDRFIAFGWDSTKITDMSWADFGQEVDKNTGFTEH
jgi:replicative DNA helicase